MNAEDNTTDERRRADDSSCTGVPAPAPNDVSSIQAQASSVCMQDHLCKTSGAKTADIETNTRARDRDWTLPQRSVVWLVSSDVTTDVTKKFQRPANSKRRHTLVGLTKTSLSHRMME